MIFDFVTLLLLAAVGLTILVIAISKPELGLSILIIVVYTNLSNVLISRFGFPSITQPLIGILIIVILARKFIFQDKFEGWSQPAILLGVYMFLGYLSVFYASDEALAKYTLVYYLKNAVIGLIIIFLLQKQFQLKWAVWSLLGAGIFMGTISTYQVFTNNIDNVYWGFGRVLDNGGGNFRLWGSIGDANYYAQIMVALIPFAVDRLLHEKKMVLRLLSGWALFVFLITVYYTFSRGGFLALLVVGFLIFARQPSRPFVWIIMLGFLLFISYEFIPAQYTQRITSLFQLVPGGNTSAKIDTSLQGRTSASIVGWAMFTDNPILGVGVGNFNANFDHYASQLGLSHEAGSAHNLYLEIAAERGIVGLLSFLMIIISTFAVLIRTKAASLDKNMMEMVHICEALITSLVGYLFAATFLHDTNIRYLWLLLGIAWSVPQVYRSLVNESVVEDKLRIMNMAYND